MRGSQKYIDIDCIMSGSRVITVTYRLWEINIVLDLRGNASCAESIRKVDDIINGALTRSFELHFDVYNMFFR